MGSVPLVHEEMDKKGVESNKSDPVFNETLKKHSDEIVETELDIGDLKPDLKSDKEVSHMEPTIPQMQQPDLVASIKERPSNLPGVQSYELPPGILFTFFFLSIKDY